MYLQEELHHQLAICKKMIQANGKISITLLHAMFSGPPRVGKSTMLSRLFELKPSPPALPQPPTAVTTENPSTGVAEKVLQVTVKPSTTLLGRASGPGMKWELQTLDSEAIALLKAIVSTVQDEASSSSASELPSASSSAADSSPEQPKPVSKKLAELITAFKQRVMRRPKTNQPSLPTTDQGSPEASRENEKSGATATVPGLKLPDELFREAFRSSQKETIQALLEGCFTIYLTDTGGQPEFQELLAALIAGPSVFFLVFNLTSSLNEKYVVEYVRPGSKSQPYVSSFTTKEVLLQSLASIACTCSHVRQGNDEMKSIAPKVVLVGTHKDIASPEQIEAIQNELKQALEETDYHRQNMIVYASRDEPVVTVDNLDPEGKDICKVRAIIEKIAEDPAFQVSVPFPMLVLSLILRGLSDPVLSYQQCRSIADECGIKTPQELNVALWFLHTKLGVVRYFPHIRELREIVIRDPQIIFDRVTDLISSTFTFEMAGQYREQQFQQTGIFTLNEIERLTATVDKLFTPARLIKLLEYLHIIAPIRDERGRVVEFFLPCVLTHALSSPSTVATDQPIPSLLVTFRCGYCPKGIFSALVVHLLSNNKTRRSAWQLKKDGMARGQVTFHAGDEYNMVTVTTHVTHLQVSVQPTRFSGRKYRENLHTVCSTIRESIDEGIVSVCKTLRYSCDTAFSFGFLCYHSSCATSKSHAANIRDEKKPHVSICSKMGSVEGLSPYHRLWFGEKLVSIYTLHLQNETKACLSSTFENNYVSVWDYLYTEHFYYISHVGQSINCST